MRKRIKIREYDGWNGKYIDFVYDNDSQVYTCDMNAWNKYVLIEKLVLQGADEAQLEELYSLGYDEGCNAAQMGM